ncbi:NCS2 family permease [Porphyromonas loveana]|uniref:AGZA family xanthine/uracil permease-like MFS transporter n=4 Tax=Porphyromonas loveana TaxID=1884669 RepID=A0A2U1FP84_9PORP|nr:NCS2 family permease [Porphyromonas loveana]PVZ14005.1 AGZA family xanthine/uracil permease-like MFS transporter [Porphyromonas loveana]
MKAWQTALGFNPSRHSVKTEFVAGLTTFLTMSYILAVNPDILSAAGMDKGAVFTATALSSAVATLLIAFMAKLPFAQAPSMGINAFFAFTLVQGMGYSWETALAAVFVEGIVFILLTAFNIREKIVDCIPYNLRYAISAGIGMFIAFIGLKNAGIIVAHPATLVALGPFTPLFLIAIIGIILSAVLVVRKVKGALFYSIAICTLIGVPLGVSNIPDSFSPVSMPQSLSPTFLKMDFAPLLSFDMAMTIFALVFMDIFNTIGTLIGAAAKTEMMDEKGNVKNIKQAMMADAIGTSLGAILGTSTVTTYVESGSGIAEGGRTGMTALVTGCFFLLALFFSPLFLLVPGAATTGALVMVGVFMLSSISMIDLSDLSEAFPVFVTLLTMVLTYSIAEGMALGMLAFVFVKLLSGQLRDVSMPLYILTVLFILRYIFA